MRRRDDFLILGFTGAFSSGCTTAARFFENRLTEVREEFVGQKSEINAKIANLYAGKNNNHLDNTKEKGLKELLKRVRKRQIINVLEKIEDVQFFYISMTDMMHSLLIESLLTGETEEADTPEAYKELINFVNKWTETQVINNEYAIQIRVALENRDIKNGNAERVYDYLEKLKLFRKELDKLYEFRPYELFDIMQRVGNNLRKCGKPFCDEAVFESSKDLDILSRRAGAIVNFHRRTKKNESPSDYLIECFRNPAEIDYFRKCFHEFYLFSVYAEEKNRYEWANKKYGLTENECTKIDKVDQGGDYVAEQYKQNVKRCVYLADIAVTNVKQPYDLYQELLKYYALIKSPGCIKPTHMERNMNLAYSMSLNSTCISRQVGAVIIKDSYIVGAGWNDTGGGRLGCVYRLRRDVAATTNENFPICSPKQYDLFKKIIAEESQDLDHSFCYKDEMGQLQKRIGRAEGNLDDSCEQFLETLEMRSLQYCRALHAEENAILQTAAIGGTRLQGATLYTTTFPCELCAKKILQIGIRKIVYCEPYPKSVSIDVFFKETTRKVELRPFEGVKSPSFFRLFKPMMDIKDMQQLETMTRKPGRAMPTD